MGRIIIRTVKKANYSHKQKFDFICTDDDVHGSTIYYRTSSSLSNASAPPPSSVVVTRKGIMSSKAIVASADTKITSKEYYQ
jgi:predicted transcriptional regulator